MIELSYQLLGEARQFRSELPRLLIGRRTNGGAPPDLNLPDPSVSREHARIWTAGGGYWVMALPDAANTALNECALPPGEASPLCLGDELKLGAVSVRVKALALEAPDAAGPAQGNRWDRLVKFMETATGVAHPVAVFWQNVVDFAVAHVPAAEGATLISYLESESHCLAHTRHAPQVSHAIIEEARRRRTAFLWPDDAPSVPTPSQREHLIQSALCAPLIAEGRVAGALFVANHGQDGAFFTDDDRRWLSLLAQAAAASLALGRWQGEAQRLGRLQTRLLAHFSPLLRARLLEQASSQNFRPGGARLLGAAVLQADMRGFSKLAAQLNPGEVIEMLNAVFAETNEAVFEHEGIVDKFIGDAVLAVFETPTPAGVPGLRAVRAALAMQEAVRRINAKRVKSGQGELAFGIGIHTGDLVQGFVGTAEKNEYTIIGDTVNQACRCCEAAGRNEVFISPEVFRPLYQDLVAEKCERNNKDGARSGYLVTGLKTRMAAGAEGTGA